MRQVIGYTLLVLALLINWPLQIGLLCLGGYIIVANFISNVWAGLITLILVAVFLPILRGIIGVVCLPLAALASTVIGESTPTDAYPYSHGQDILQEHKIEYIGSMKSNVYHRPNCSWAQRIAPNEDICFDSIEDAESFDYKPCAVCKPRQIMALESKA